MLIAAIRKPRRSKNRHTPIPEPARLRGLTDIRPASSPSESNREPTFRNGSCTPRSEHMSQTALSRTQTPFSARKEPGHGQPVFVDLIGSESAVDITKKVCLPCMTEDVCSPLMRYSASPILLPVTGQPSQSRVVILTKSLAQLPDHYNSCQSPKFLESISHPDKSVMPWSIPISTLFIGSLLFYMNPNFVSDIPLSWTGV
jgi:hypothetical protein